MHNRGRAGNIGVDAGVEAVKGIADPYIRPGTEPEIILIFFVIGRFYCHSVVCEFVEIIGCKAVKRMHERRAVVVGVVKIEELHLIAVVHRHYIADPAVFQPRKEAYNCFAVHFFLRVC